MARNGTLNSAARAKKDEFYTQRADIERELRHYRNFFAGKSVLCNCDDPRRSEFVKYFAQNFGGLGLKKLIATCRADSGAPACMTEFFSPDDCSVTRLAGDGDFRSPECVDALKEADVVVTNPPFSLFREYVALLVKHDKKFLIIGNINCITYKEIFPLIVQNKVWLGYGMGRAISGFVVPDDYELYGTEARIDGTGRRIVATNQCLWLTNIELQKRHENITLFKRRELEPELFPRYENYDAIEVPKTAFIPVDYEGVMGVPITFLDKYNPAQFEILGHTSSNDLSPAVEALRTDPANRNRGLIGGRQKYDRILIRRRDAR